MKSNLTKTILDWALATSLILSIVFFIQYLNRTRALRTPNPALQAELNKFQSNRIALNALAVESLEYAKRDPSIKPVLDAIRANPGPAAPAATTTPAAK